MQPRDPLLSRLAPRDQALLRITFDGTSYIHRFVLGPEHANSLINHLFVSFNASPDALLGVFLACSGRFSSKFRLSAYTDVNLDYSNCARAVQSLREMADTASIKTPDLVTVLTLGLGIVTFDLLETGMYAHSISRHTLTLADRHLCLSTVYPRQRARIMEDVGPNLLPLVLMDTYNCLVRRQVPIMRLQLQNTETVDKYIGVCWPLMPHLYDICCLSCRISSLPSATPGQKLEGGLPLDITQGLDVVETALHSWHPSIPARTMRSSTAREVEILETQANIYKSAILLVIHRLRHPLGHEDETAWEWSCIILAGIERLLSVAARTPDGHTALGQESNFDYRLAFPFFVAAVEVADPIERAAVLDKLSSVVSAELYSHVLGMMRRAIVHIWGNRDEDSGSYLLDIISEGPPLVLF